MGEQDAGAAWRLRRARCRLATLAGVLAFLFLPVLAPPFVAGHARPPALVEGPKVKILDSAELPEGKHYINDHALLRLPDGRWILTGIFHPEPSQARDERAFVLALAPASEPSAWYAAGGPSFFIAPERAALRASADEPWIWAPHVVRDGAGGFAMVYHAGALDPDRASIRLARSRDGLTWAREERALFEDICTARDPMLLRLGST